MKQDTINTIMTYVLGALAFLGVWFALRGVFGQHEFRQLQFTAAQDNQSRMLVDAIASDTMAYYQKNPNPELLRILQGAGAKPPAPKQ
jgi:hypothetical protein